MLATRLVKGGPDVAKIGHISKIGTENYGTDLKQEKSRGREGGREAGNMRLQTLLPSPSGPCVQD